MAAALELGVEEDAQDLLGQLGGDDPRADRQHVGVVVLARDAGRCRGRCTARRARRAPCWRRSARPGRCRRARCRRRRRRATTARADAPRRSAGSRPVLGAVGAEVVDVVAPLLQHRDEVLLQREARVVGADRDPHAASVPTGARSAPGVSHAPRLRCVNVRRRGAAAGHTGDAAPGRRHVPPPARPRARGRQAARQPVGRRPLRGRRTGSSPTPGSRTPSSGRRGAEAFVEPHGARARATRACTAPAVRGLPRRVRRPARARAPTSAGGRTSTTLGVDLVGDLGLALELPDGRRELRVLQARRPPHRRAAARPGRAARARSSAPRSGRPTSSTIVAADLIEQESSRDTPDLAASAPRPRAWITERVELVAAARGRRPRRAPAPTARAARSSPAATQCDRRERDEAPPAPTSCRSRRRTSTTSCSASAGSSTASCSACPPATPAPSNDHGPARRTTCCGAIHATGSCHDDAHVADVLAGHGADSDARAPARRRATRSGARPTAPTRAAHEHELARFHRQPRADVHGHRAHRRDLDPRRAARRARLQDRPAVARRGCADVPAAKVQAFVLAPAARKPRAAAPPPLRVPAAGRRRRSRAVGARRRRPRRDRGGAARGRRAHADLDDWNGVADADVCCALLVPLDLPRQRGAGRSRRGRCSAPRSSDRARGREM